jgi:hypothetical protein
MRYRQVILGGRAEGKTRLPRPPVLVDYSHEGGLLEEGWWTAFGLACPGPVWVWFRVVVLLEGLAEPTFPLAYRAGAAPSQRNSRAAVFRREDGDEACDHRRTIRAAHQRRPLLA